MKSLRTRAVTLRRRGWSYNVISARLELVSKPRANRVARASGPNPRNDDDAVLEVVLRGGVTPEAARCRRNPLSFNWLGRSASARGVARRSRTRLRVRHAPRALRASPLGPARSREVLKPTLGSYREADDAAVEPAIPHIQPRHGATAFSRGPLGTWGAVRGATPDRLITARCKGRSKGVR